MARPRKYPEPAPAPAPADSIADEIHAPDDDELLEPGELVARALENPRARLTPDTLEALNKTWRDLAQADDDDARMTARRIVSRLRRASHAEVHPGCQRVTITVPVLKRPDGRGGMWYVKINERTFVGEVEVWECEARTIAELVHRYRQVEANRLSDDQHYVDLDSGTLAERARTIQRA
jgi:hypothetical protein